MKSLWRDLRAHPSRGERESFASTVCVYFGEVPPRKGSVMIGKGGFTRYFKLGHRPIPQLSPPSPPLSLDPDDSSFEPGQASLDRRPFNATFFRVYPRRQFIRRKEDDSLEIYKSGIAEIRVVIYYREEGKGTRVVTARLESGRNSIY